MPWEPVDPPPEWEPIADITGPPGPAGPPGAPGEADIPDLPDLTVLLENALA